MRDQITLATCCIVSSHGTGLMTEVVVVVCMGGGEAPDLFFARKVIIGGVSCKILGQHCPVKI